MIPLEERNWKCSHALALWVGRMLTIDVSVEVELNSAMQESVVEDKPSQKFATATNSLFVTEENTLKAEAPSANPMLFALVSNCAETLSNIE
jgi:hypothetical protein